MHENFDEKARTWDSDPKKVLRAQSVAQAIIKAIPLNTKMTALEYGCGTGLLSFELLPYLKHITLMDSSSGMIEVLTEKILSRKIENMKPVQTDLISENITNEQYDIIFTLMALHHILNTRIIVQKFHSILNKNGYLAIVDLDKEDGSFHNYRTDVLHGFDRDLLKRTLKNIGLHILYDDICYQTCKITKDNEEKSYSLFLLVCQKPGNIKNKVL